MVLTYGQDDDVDDGSDMKDLHIGLCVINDDHQPFS